MECGHGGICYECGKQLISVEPRVCHLCREGISYILKMDLGVVYSNFFKVLSATFVDDESDDEDSQNQSQEENRNHPSQQASSQQNNEGEVQAPVDEVGQTQEQANQNPPTNDAGQEGPIYFLENPFYSQQDERAQHNERDVIEFVSPRPNEFDNDD
mmetsp:Transcript_33518/g.32588  ORF Transcript_33518/g.32588 Transcript_33518/m.32588 type:complete len:157 (-) Transcript_33518:114-584(-)